ncbi:MAG: type II secretion system protein [Candidatus Riflebacteria bacterium]|nr:type II secretion system protein [Candidatus Riflebacteria bacterium]
MSRRGFHLTEVLVALALAGGPLLAVLNLIQTSSQGARRNQQETTARLAALDLVEGLARLPVDTLRAVTPERRGAWLDDELDRRGASMLPEAREAYEHEVRSLRGRLAFDLEERAGGHAGLVRFTVTVTLARGRPIRVTRLVRPAACRV